jgi:hypothetical protein
MSVAPGLLPFSCKMRIEACRAEFAIAGGMVLELQQPSALEQQPTSLEGENANR